MLYLEGTTCFQNWEPKFLDLITYMSCMNKTLSSLPFLLVVKRKHKGFLCFPRLFIQRRKKFCVPEERNTRGGLMCHFGVDKTLSILKDKFYYLHRKRSPNHCHRCIACLQVKFRIMPYG